MNQTRKESSAAVRDRPSPRKTKGLVTAFHGVRYQVSDVSRSVAFYTKQLGFTLDMQHLPAFATVSVGDLKMMLSGPEASGSRPMPNGAHQEPGGWNRVILGRIKAARIPFRSTVHGPTDMKVDPTYSNIYWNEPDGHMWEILTVSYARAP